MFVCVCNAVTDREIREHARRGVDSLEDLRLRTGCGDCCGQCADEAQAILENTRHAARVSLPMADYNDCGLAQPA